MGQFKVLIIPHMKFYNLTVFLTSRVLKSKTKGFIQTKMKTESILGSSFQVFFSCYFMLALKAAVKQNKTKPNSYFQCCPVSIC